MHLHSILHGINSMYRLIVDSNMMDIVTVTVEDYASKPRTIRAFLNWNFIWQRFLGKESSA